MCLKEEKISIRLVLVLLKSVEFELSFGHLKVDLERPKLNRKYIFSYKSYQKNKNARTSALILRFEW